MISRYSTDLDPNTSMQMQYHAFHHQQSRVSAIKLEKILLTYHVVDASTVAVFTNNGNGLKKMWTMSSHLGSVL